MRSKTVCFIVAVLAIASVSLGAGINNPLNGDSYAVGTATIASNGVSTPFSGGLSVKARRNSTWVVESEANCPTPYTGGFWTGDLAKPPNGWDDGGTGDLVDVIQLYAGSTVIDSHWINIVP